MFNSKISVVLLHISIVLICFQTEKVLTTDPEKYILVAVDSSAMPTDVSIASCTNLKAQLVAKVSVVNTRGYCARFWDDLDCTGNSIEVMPRSPSHYDLNVWGFDNMAISVGPCRNPCDITVTGVQPQDPFQITIFQRRNYEGSLTHRSHSLTVAGCTSVPSPWNQNFASVRTHGHCLQLWSNEGCVVNENSTDDTIELRSGTPLHSDIKTGWWMDKVAAVSHCRYKCEIETPETDPSTMQHGTSDNESSSSAWLWILVLFFVLASVGIVGYILIYRGNLRQWRTGVRTVPTKLMEEF